MGKPIDVLEVNDFPTSTNSKVRRALNCAHVQVLIISAVCWTHVSPSREDSRQVRERFAEGLALIMRELSSSLADWLALLLCLVPAKTEKLAPMN